MSGRRKVVWSAAVVVALVLIGRAMSVGASTDGDRRSLLPEGSIDAVMVIDLENENYATTFGSGSPAVYLNETLLRRGELLVNYFATSHVSLGNYLSQVSGQAPTPDINSDCIDVASLSNPPTLGAFTDVTPGLDADQRQFPGQVLGNGCVFPAPGPTTRGVLTIGDQLDQGDLHDG